MRMTSDVTVTKNSARKTAIVMVLTSIVIIIVALTIVIGYQTGLFYNDFSCIATVNGVPVYVREYKIKLKSKNIEVMDYFKQKYKIENSNKFWSNSFNGEVPGEIARKKALDDIVRLKVVQILAKEKGIIKSADYKDFLNELEKENKLREDALKNNKVIYGPSKYGEVEYFTYTYENMVAKLKEKLKDKELAISEDKLVDMYKVFKKSKFKLPDNIKIQKIAVSFADDKGVINEDRKRYARIKIQEAKSRLNNGEAFEDVSRQYNKNSDVLEQTFTKEDLHKDNTLYTQILDGVNKVEEGRISEIIEERTEFLIVKCIKREDMGFLSYEDARDMIKNELIDRDYINYIDSLVEEADVRINEKLYKRLNVR